MAYVDGFCIPVATAKRNDYIAHARRFAALFKEHGASRVVECWGDDVPDGKLTSFPLAVKRGEGETVVFSWVEWPSRAARDAAWEKLRNDPRMQAADGGALFDGKRLIYGGFDMIVEA